MPKASHGITLSNTSGYFHRSHPIITPGATISNINTRSAFIGRDHTPILCVRYLIPPRPIPAYVSRLRVVYPPCTPIPQFNCGNEEGRGERTLFDNGVGRVELGYTCLTDGGFFLVSAFALGNGYTSVR